MKFCAKILQITEKYLYPGYNLLIIIVITYLHGDAMKRVSKSFLLTKYFNFTDKFKDPTLQTQPIETLFQHAYKIIDIL